MKCLVCNRYFSVTFYQPLCAWYYQASQENKTYDGDFKKSNH